MGEVSENSSENATEKMNGDINGACDEDEAMDVDSQSQDESVTTSLKEANIEEVTTEDNDDSTVDSNGQDHDPLGGDDGGVRGGPHSTRLSGRDGQKSGKENEKINGHGTDDDDNAVIIHSDSDSDVVATDIDLSECDKGRNGTEVHEILSDKEDCVVIEDPKEQQRRSSRQRKTMVKVRDYTTYDDDDDVEEIIEDPLTERPTMLKKAKMLPQDLSVTPVNRMPEIKATHQKEPTLVIIDTNTMLNSRTAGNSMMQSIKNASSVVNTSASTTSGYSVMPVGVPAQGIYPPNIRATITPVTPSSSSMPKGLNLTTPQMQPPVLLPALTDDMFVLEAPSFIVPYIYEKPPQDDLKEVVQKMSVELEELRKKEESEMEQDSEESTAEDGENAAAAAPKEAEGEDDKEKSSKKGRRRRKKNPDDSWDESDTSTDEEASDSEERTKVLIKEAKEDLDTIKKHIITPETAAKATAAAAAAAVTTTPTEAPKKPSDNYFESPLGQFFMTIGINLVQEHVQTDLLRLQKKKRNQDSARLGQIQTAINSLMKNLEISKIKNEPFKFENKRCEFCNFKTESSLAMANHYEKPHFKNNMFTCNFCQFSSRLMHDIMFHMEAVHNIKCKMEKALPYHVCPNCPFEDNGKSKMARHALSCAKKFAPEMNLAPPVDWEPPAKIPRIKPRHGLVGTATAYQQMAAQQQRAQAVAMPRLSINPVNAMRGRGRPHTVTNKSPVGTVLRGSSTSMRPILPTGMVLSNNYSMAPTPNASMMQQVASTTSKSTKSLQQQPSISITPLPRQGSTTMTPAALQAAAAAAAAAAATKNLKPGQHPGASGGKSTFVICEICDGYIKDLDQLRSHMQWIHKVKIHPKMIYNRPPLNCQKCQFRFFTDQGLERHLLGSHGLVTSSMQEAANRGQDSGRCPVCGRVYQWKLLNHVSRDHNMTLKPAHLSYKCTVCTATFGMYKQFENHVYSAHSTVAKKAMDGKKSGGGSSSSSMGGSHSKGGGGGSSSSGGDSLLKPLKINDEITIIPQPATKPGKSSHPMEIESHVID